MEQQTANAPQGNKQPLKQKNVFVINDDLDFNIFLQKLDYFAKNGIQVAINPSILPETIFATIREYNYFIMMEYDPNKMSHRIATVMPEMTPFSDEYGEKSPFEGISVEETVEKAFEYPER